MALGLTQRIETVAETLTAPFSEGVIRIGVTGLARSGKTVIITSLVANLLDRGRMGQWGAAARVEAAYLQPQPDDTVPRFDFEAHLADLTGAAPKWPDSTRAVSELRVSLKVRPQGLLGAVSGPRTVHVDIVDYPGEWLLDLGLMEKSYAHWSRETLARMAERDEAAEFLAALSEGAVRGPHDEALAQRLTRVFTGALQAARAAGYSDCTPGRFLMPGELEGAPALTFVPLPEGAAPRGSLAREMARRYEAYKAQIVRPFFRDHFAKIDRQVVLVDVLGAIHAGPAAVEDLRRAMAETLVAFRPGGNGFLTRLLRGRQVERILFAATKADHLHHSQHGRLTGIMEALVRQARDRADFAGAKTAALSIAALRATVEQTLSHDGQELDCVRGTLLDSGKQAAFYPGELPDDPAALLGPARAGAAKWLDADWKVMRFAPAPLTRKPGEGPPHIRLDRAAEFLLGDRL